eukprot:999310-Amphidinium_carterae.1
MVLSLHLCTFKTLQRCEVLPVSTVGLHNGLLWQVALAPDTTQQKLVEADTAYRRELARKNELAKASPKARIPPPPPTNQGFSASWPMFFVTASRLALPTSVAVNLSFGFRSPANAHQAKSAGKAPQGVKVVGASSNASSIITRIRRQRAL